MLSNITSNQRAVLAGDLAVAMLGNELLVTNAVGSTATPGDAMAKLATQAVLLADAILAKTERI